MDWSPAYSWLAIALLLCLAELTSGAMVLLALGVAALLTAAVTALGITLPWQLLSMGVFSGILVPIGVMVIRPRFSPKGVAYGTTGTGAEKGNHYTTFQRDFDDATVIKVNGDDYRLRVLENGATTLPKGTQVILKRFEGTTALVKLSPPLEHSHETDQSNHQEP